MLWGRAAAFMMRLSASVYPADLLRLQCFVDDPWMIARGSARARRKRMTGIILLWLALGLSLSWRKKQIAFEVRWIGVTISLTRDEIWVGLPADFVAKVLKDITDLMQLRAIPAKRLRKTTGALTWISGVVIFVRAFIAPLWAALASTAHWDGPPDAATVSQRQVSQALRWLALFLSGNRGTLTRRIRAAPRHFVTSVQIVTDACPWGVGGVLFVNDLPVAWFSSELLDLDLEMLEAERGNPQGQAAFEGLALLIALRSWAHVWKDESAFILTRSDSIAALGALIKGNARATTAGGAQLNRVMQEVALDAAEGTYEVQVVGHLPAMWNTWADALSRTGQPGKAAAIPAELEDIDRTDVEDRGPAWWRTRSPPS